MTRIARKESKEEELVIPPIRVSLLKVAYLMQPDKELESLGQDLSTMNINTLEEDKVKGDDQKIESGKEDEVLPQITIYTMEEVFANTFIWKLAKGEIFKTRWPRKLHWCLKCNLVLLVLICILFCFCLLCFFFWLTFTA